MLHAAEGNALVTASALKMRATPSLSGDVVMTLARGEMIVVQHFSDERITVDGVLAPWAHVTAPDGKSGWVFGGFITNNYQYLNENMTLIAWIQSQVRQSGPADFEVTLYDVAKKKLTRVPVLSEICEKFGFSQDLKYLAVDDGTYVYANLHIYRVQDKKLLYSRQYTPRVILWKGNTLEFNEVLCDKDGDLKSEPNAFNNGKFQKSLEARRKAECG